MYLIGETSHGHHQIEMACDSCHTSPFGGGEVLQDACVSCHGDELKLANDAHPKSKFTNPRNADRIDILDARYCVTCHREHKEGITGEMGLTLPGDYCLGCHQDVGEKRPTHKGLAFDSCASSGCHNYHDNLALYEDFLLRHAEGKAMIPVAERASLLVEKHLAVMHSGEVATAYGTPPNWSDLAIPAASRDETALAEWHDSGHAQAGVTCQSCHQPDAGMAWQQKPEAGVCSDCHQGAAQGFVAGKHGMRIAAGLAPMTPAMARIPMKSSSANLELGCLSCHSPHAVTAAETGFETCIGCHDSSHVRNFENSPHADLLFAARKGEIALHEKVDCATCHMPLEQHHEKGRDVLRVNHNQNANLRPNEKMIRSVCMSCHSLAFSIDSLADKALIESNFNGHPSVHVQSIDMALEREAELSK